MKKKKNKMKYRRQESSEREEKILNKRLFFLYLFIFSSTQHNPRLDPFRDFDIRGIARFSTQFPLPIIAAIITFYVNLVSTQGRRVY